MQAVPPIAINNRWNLTTRKDELSDGFNEFIIPANNTPALPKCVRKLS